MKEEDDPERFRQLVAEVDRDTTPWELARLYEAQYVLDPRDTRSWLKRVLDVHRMRHEQGGRAGTGWRTGRRATETVTSDH